ncbi:MAG: DUF2452 domain-containing protein [Burkholderiales bacterium]|nr:DUF2452 domain-containing protein [Bacteroidia bacterium]
MINPIDKDKVAENPGLIAYPHTIGSLAIKPEDVGKVKSRALSAMYEQTDMQLLQIQKQVELLVSQANEIKQRIEVSEKIYTAVISFDPLVGHVYHLYKKDSVYRLMMISPDEWGRSRAEALGYVNTVRLLSDHTWEIINNRNVLFV